MKKIFLFAAAAVVMMSSCSKTEEVYVGKPQAIGFHSAVVRGIIQTNADMTYDLSVTSVWDNPTDGVDGQYAPYFEDAKFVYDAQQNLWKGAPAQYWPTSGNMHFLAVSPYPVQADLVTNYNTDGTIKDMVFGTIQNNLMDQHDVLFSDMLSVAAPQTAAQPLLFHHAYAQLNVGFKKTESAANVVVNSVRVKKAFLNGTLTITPAATPAHSTAVWATPGIEFATPRYFLDADATGVEDGVLDAVLSASEAFTPKPIVVIPSAQTEIEIVYTIDGKQQKYVHTLTGEWLMGYKYTYNYTINVNEIMFSCTVDEWIPVDGGSITI